MARKRDRAQHVVIPKWWRANPREQESYISVVQDQNGADTKAAEVTEITNGPPDRQEIRLPVSISVINRNLMKCYSADIQVDFETPRDMLPRPASGKSWRAVGYFQYFFCTERSKEKAKQLIIDFVRKNEDIPHTCKFKCTRIAWMRGLTKREQIAFGFSAGLTDAMFEKRGQIGIWFHTDKHYYVSESDYAASMLEDYYEHESEEDL